MVLSFFVLKHRAMRKPLIYIAYLRVLFARRGVRHSFKSLKSLDDL